MTFSMNDDAVSRQSKRDLAHEEWEVIERELRAERKILNRDWEVLSPRERSSQSRVVKELEEQKQILQEAIESFGAF